MLSSLIHALYQLSYLKPTKPDGTLYSYSYSYRGRLTDQRITVNPGLPYEAFRKICRSAISGSLQDMGLVALMYNVGYGLPVNRHCAEAWTSFAVLDADHDFKGACKQLRRDYRQAPETIYPDQLIVPFQEVVQGLGSEGLYAMYRKLPGVAPNIYAALFNGQLADLEKLVALGVPNFLEGNHEILIAEDFIPTTFYVLSVDLESLNGRPVQELYNAWDGQPLLARSAFDEPTQEMVDIQQEMQSIERRIQRGDSLEVELVRHRRKLERLQQRDIDAEYCKYLETKPLAQIKLHLGDLYRFKDGLVNAGTFDEPTELFTDVQRGRI